jgi:GR25 family glycosyltransferase involved in LPS biosynthesis
MRFLLVLLFSMTFVHAAIEKHYKKIEHKRGGSSVRNIDYIYVINLDQRPERWDRTVGQLFPYGIFPQRFSAIYGWSLTPEVLHDIGMKFQHGMWTGRENVMHFPLGSAGNPEFVWLSGASYGKAYFSGWTVKGTIGCSLSHLSVLNDAYESGYNTVWIMEDDICVKDDPHKLSDLIDELDAIAEWDMLYTDFDWLVVDRTRDLASEIPMMWRPDMGGLNISYLAEHRDLGKFVKIGSRMRAHSIIYRRSGMKKILDFYKAHDNFLPYDNEVALIPTMQMYVLKDEIVSVHETNTDTRYKYFP